MSVWITGAAGLLGANLSRHLIAAGVDVTGLDDLSGGYRSSLPVDPLFTFHQVDLNNFEYLTELAKRDTPETIYHFAAYAAEGLSPFVRRYNYLNNVLGSASIINVAIENDSKVIFTSSMAVYGDQIPPFQETYPRKPVDPYGIAKSAVEQDLECAKKQHGLRYTIVRPHNVVGRFQNIWDRYRNVIGIFIRRGLAGEPLLVFGDGSQSRAFSDVAFYMEPFERLAATGDSEIYNLGADKACSILEGAELVVKALAENGIAANIEFAEGRHEVHDAYCDHSKAKRDLNFQDNTDLEKCIRQMVDWALAVQPQSVREMKYEVKQGLYSYWK